MSKPRVMLLLVLLVAAGASPIAQTSPDETEEGIPVASRLVRDRCAACHPGDAQGRMSRISFQRSTPEGWQQVIRRMVLLQDVQVSAADARAMVRYLANDHGLAPEEARPGAFEVERRLLDYRYDADVATQETCNRCHSFGRVLGQRRTRREWELLASMHQGYYPLVDFQSFYRGAGRRDPDDPDAPWPIDEAIDHLSSAFPLHTPEWSAWAANVRSPRLAGRWALTGSQQGRGPVYGYVVVSARAGAPDEFDTQISYVYARTGERVTRAGESLVYTGFQWRGRSATSDGDLLREVMAVDRDWRVMTGRWFTGDHDELGLDVTLTRVGSDPVVTGVHPPSVSTADSGVTLTIHGVNLSERLSPDDVDLGPGVTIQEVVEASATRAVVRATLSDATALGRRDLFLSGAFLEDAVAVYDEVHRLEVTPDTGMARVGGVVFPKRYEQFEARGYHDGPDGVARTADDLDLGVMDVTWAIEEYAAIYGDDDIRFVGELDQSGFFTPALDGPNPDRANNANNVGDVWVVATLSPDGSTVTGPLRARAHLLVTVPLYIRRDATVDVR